MPTPERSIDEIVEELIRTIEIVTFPYDKWTDKDKETVGNILRKTLQTERQKQEEMVEAERNFAGQFMTPEDGAAYLQALTQPNNPK